MIRHRGRTENKPRCAVICMGLLFFTSHTFPPERSRYVPACWTFSRFQCELQCNIGRVCMLANCDFPDRGFLLGCRGLVAFGFIWGERWVFSVNQRCTLSHVHLPATNVDSTNVCWLIGSKYNPLCVAPAPFVPPVTTTL